MNKLFYVFTLIVLANTLIIAQTPAPTPKTIISGVINGKAVRLVKPEYPDSARAANAGGQVKVQVTIDEQGNVIIAKATDGPEHLREVSEKAALQSKFSPTTLEGQPVKVTGTIVYNFQAPERVQSNEEKLKFMGIGAFLAIARILLLNEWQDFPIKDLGNEIELKESLMPLAAITSQTSREEQIKILDKVTASLDQTLTGDSAWQYRFGKEFGELMIRFQEAQQNHNNNYDEKAVKAHLSKMQVMIGTAPADFPPAVLAKFKELTGIAALDNLNSPENKLRLMGLIGDTLNTISPENK